MRVARKELTDLPLHAHAILADVPLRDVTAIDLPGGGPGRTLDDVGGTSATHRGNPLVRALFGVRHALGRVFGWDREKNRHPELSYLSRVPAELAARSLKAPGSVEAGFRVLYQLDREALSEIRNATVHAFLSQVLLETANGYRLYFGVYVKPVSWLTPMYMALIEPFRRFIVYPSLFGRVRAAWRERYGT